MDSVYNSTKSVFMQVDTGKDIAARYSTVDKDNNNSISL